MGSFLYTRALVGRHPGWVGVLAGVFLFSIVLSTCWPMLHTASHESVNRASSSVDTGDIGTHHPTTTDSTVELCCITQVGLNDYEAMPLATYTGSDLRVPSPDATLVRFLEPSLGDVRVANARSWAPPASAVSPIYLTTLRLRI